jgi:hypothetical protein
MYVVEKSLQNTYPIGIKSIKKITVAIKNIAITNERVTNAIKKITNAPALNAGILIPKKPY